MHLMEESFLSQLDTCRRTSKTELRFVMIREKMHIHKHITREKHEVGEIFLKKSKVFSLFTSKQWTERTSHQELSSFFTRISRISCPVQPSKSCFDSYRGLVYLFIGNLRCARTRPRLSSIDRPSRLIPSGS